MSLMEIFTNPDTIHTLTFGQKMQGSLITMALGLGITFLVLILIWVFIAIMGRCIGGTGKKKEATAQAPAAAVATPSAAPVAPAAPASVSLKSDDTLIAVIAAAIAAQQGTSANNLVVKKITRLSGEETPWTAAGISARMDTRF